MITHNFKIICYFLLKNLPANAGDVRDPGSIPGSGISPGEGNGNPLQYSCLENPTDRGAWQATVHRIAKSWIWLKWLSMHKPGGQNIRRQLPLKRQLTTQQAMPGRATCRSARDSQEAKGGRENSGQEYLLCFPWEGKGKNRFAQMLSCAQFFATPCTVAHQILSMGFSRQEYQIRLPFKIS